MFESSFSFWKLSDSFVMSSLNVMIISQQTILGCAWCSLVSFHFSRILKRIKQTVTHFPYQGVDFCNNHICMCRLCQEHCQLLGCLLLDSVLRSDVNILRHFWSAKWIFFCFIPLRCLFQLQFIFFLGGFYFLSVLSLMYMMV